MRSLVGAIAFPTMMICRDRRLHPRHDPLLRGRVSAAGSRRGSRSGPPTADLKKMLDEGSWELKEVLLAQTWKQFSDPRLNASSDAAREVSTNALAAPSTRLPGDPVFRINGGPPVVSFTFMNARFLTQQAFVSQGWFVTREMQLGTPDLGAMEVAPDAALRHWKPEQPLAPHSRDPTGWVPRHWDESSRQKVDHYAPRPSAAVASRHAGREPRAEAVADGVREARDWYSGDLQIERDGSEW